MKIKIKRPKGDYDAAAAAWGVMTIGILLLLSFVILIGQGIIKL